MQGPIRTNQERWVHEKGLPHAYRDPLWAHLGKRLLLPTDLTASSRLAETRAFQLAVQTGARLVILAVVPPQGADTALAARQLAARLRLARMGGIEAAGWMVTGDPGERVVEAAAAIGADAIIMAADQWSSLPNGACVCGHVIRLAPCHVLITGGRQ